MFANSQGGGDDFGFPDVCKTPVGPSMVPLPYPNTASGTMGVPAVYNILYQGAPAQNLGTKIPLSNGDNLGVGRGLISNKHMGESRSTTGAFTCLIGGKPATRVSSVTLQNGQAPGARISPSQTKVLILAP